jgi:DNA polymerase III alpha subunit (gram-positive type)
MRGAKRIYAAFDTEFVHTRWNLVNARLCQLACVTNDATFNRYIKGTDITGTFLDGKLCKDDLANGVELEVALREFNEFLEINKVTHLIGHNPIGDARLLFHKARECGIQMKRLPVYDTMDVCQMVDVGKSCKLEHLYQRHFANDNKTAHNAVDDSEMTLKIFMKHEDYLGKMFSFVPW